MFNKPRGELPLEEAVPEGMGSALPLMKALGGGGVQEETFTEDIPAPSISTPSIPRSQTRAEEDLANYLGLRPEVATGVFDKHKAFQEELGKKPKVVNPYTNAERIVKILPNGTQTIAFYKKGKPVTKENQIGVTMHTGTPDATKGQRQFTISDFDTKGNPQVTVMTLGPDLEVIQSKVFGKGKGPEGKSMPTQARLLATFLMQRALEDKETNPLGKQFEDMNEAEQANITKLIDVAQNPAAYLMSPEGKKIFLEFGDFLKEKNMAEIMVDLFKEINKMEEGGGGNPFIKK